MKTDTPIELLLQMIQLANEDGVQTTEVEMSDLMVLVNTIEELQLDVKALIESKLSLQEEVALAKYRSKLANISNIKANLSVLDRPVKLKVYA